MIRMDAPTVLMNYSKKQATILKGTVIGYLEPIPVVPDDPRYWTRDCNALRMEPSSSSEASQSSGSALETASEDRIVSTGSNHGQKRHLGGSRGV